MDTTDFKSGFVAIIGRPNSGKSSLLNALLGSKISIVSSVPQTTRHCVRGVLNLPGSQVVFVDTPGIHSFKDPLALHLNVAAKNSLEGCDLVLYVADSSRKTGKEEEVIVDFLLKQKIKQVMVLNKIDLGGKYVSDYMELWKHKLTVAGVKADPVISYLPASALTGKNIDVLKGIIIENMPSGLPFYDEQAVTDFPLNFRVADCVREKLFLSLKGELPHSLAVEVEEIKDKGKIVYIKVNIYINRLSQKKIIIGKSGANLKEIGVLARGDIEKIVGKKVYLDIWIKVLPDWQEKPRILNELGYF